MIEHELFWRVLEIPKGKDLKVFMLEYFTKFSKSSLTSVIINAKVPEEDLEGILEILEESGEVSRNSTLLSILVSTLELEHLQETNFCRFRFSQLPAWAIEEVKVLKSNFT